MGRKPKTSDIKGLTVRPEAPEELEAVSEVLKRAFGRPEEAGLVEALRKTKDFVPGLSLVAVLGGKVVGHILFFPIIVKSRSKDHCIISMAPVAVQPDEQRIGIGSELVRKGLKKCKAVGHKVVVVIGHPNYYPRFGFVQARPKGLEVPFEVPDDVFMVIELVNGAMKGISGVVQYPPEFNGV